MQEEITYSTFDGFRPHFDALARVGYFKVVMKPLSRSKRYLHDAYRLISTFLIIVYNIQHLIRVVQVRHSTDQMVDTLFILLTTITTLGKQAAFNQRSRRIDNIIKTIDGPYFVAAKPYHVQVLKANALTMSRLLTLYHCAVIICGSMWATFPLVNRALGEEVQFTGYIPFDTTETKAFLMTTIYMNILITFQAYGNVTMDCTIVAFYAQAKIQIQILRYNLEQLVEFDAEEINEKAGVQERLKKCIVHYQVIIGFIEEVRSIFGEAMVIQFFVIAWVICMTMYKIVELNLISAEFASMAMYLICMLAQLFIYCYFGTQLKVESEFLNTSIYSSDWLSVSPRIRRQLLIMMQRYARPITPRIAYVVPMSLETYIAVLRASYTLFTLLKKS